MNHRPPRSFFLLNCSALFLCLSIIFLSTHIRLGEAGLGCTPWPTCYAPLSLADGVKGLAIADSEFRLFRSLHRSVASLLGLNVLLIFVLALRQRISLRLPGLMCLVVLFLALAGVVTPTRSFPLVTLGNILGGILLAGLLWRQLLLLRSIPRSTHSMLLSLLLTLVSLQILTGAWASANYTAAACPQLLRCSHTVNITASLPASFNPLRKLALDENDRLLPDTPASIIQMSHRLAAVCLLALVVAAMHRVKRYHAPLRKPLAILAMLFCAEFMLGVVNVLTAMPLWTNTLHNLLAVVLLFAAINLGLRLRSAKSPRSP